MKLLLSLSAASQPVLLACNSCNLWLNIYDSRSVFLWALKRDMRTEWPLLQKTSETIKTYFLFVKYWNPQLVIKMNTISTAMAFDLKGKKSQMQNDWSTTKTNSHFPNCKSIDSVNWFVIFPPPKNLEIGGSLDMGLYKCLWIEQYEALFRQTDWHTQPLT